MFTYPTVEKDVDTPALERMGSSIAVGYHRRYCPLRSGTMTKKVPRLAWHLAPPCREGWKDSRDLES